MEKSNARLTELTPEEVRQLQRQAEHLIRLDDFLSRLPLGLQAEYLTEEGFEWLRLLDLDTEWKPDNPLILRWHSMRRAPIGLAHHNSV